MESKLDELFLIVKTKLARLSQPAVLVNKVSNSTLDVNVIPFQS